MTEKNGSETPSLFVAVKEEEKVTITGSFTRVFDYAPTPLRTQHPAHSVGIVHGEVAAEK